MAVDKQAYSHINIVTICNKYTFKNSQIYNVYNTVSKNQFWLSNQGQNQSQESDSTTYFVFGSEQADAAVTLHSVLR